jgi:hypothetical protein
MKRNALRTLAASVALGLLLGCGSHSNSGGGGGGNSPTGEPTPLASPVAVPSDFFENGAKQVGILVTGTSTTEPTAILVGTDGHVLLTQSWTGTPRRTNLPGALTQKFFADLAAARPVDNHPAGPCNQGVWGTESQLYVSLGGHPSADLFCPGDAQMTTLHDDVMNILKQLSVQPAPRSSPQPVEASPTASSAPGGAKM